MCFRRSAQRFELFPSLVSTILSWGFVSAHTSPQVDNSEKRVIGGRSLSALYRHRTQLFVAWAKQRNKGIPARQRNPHLAHADANECTNLQQLQANGDALGLG